LSCGLYTTYFLKLDAPIKRQKIANPKIIIVNINLIPNIARSSINAYKKSKELKNGFKSSSIQQF